MPFPATDCIDDLGRDEETRARDGAAGVQVQARLRQELRLAQEPRGIASGNPVRTIVLRVAVARRSLGAVVEGLVHLAEVVHVEHVVGVEHEISFVTAISVLGADRLDAEVKRVTLADLVEVVAAEHDGTRLLGNLGRVISAVVGHDEDVDEFLRIVLHLDRMDQVADDGAFVSSRNQDRITVVLLSGELGRLRSENLNDVEQLVRIANGERKKHAEVEHVNERDLREKLVYQCALLLPVSACHLQ